MIVNERPLDVQSRNKEGWKTEAVDGSKQHSIDRGSYFLLTGQEILERICQLEILMSHYLALRVRFQMAPGQRGGRAQGPNIVCYCSNEQNRNGIEIGLKREALLDRG